jgi:hypothetical protein
VYGLKGNIILFFETYAKLVNDFPADCDQLFGQPLITDHSLWLSVDSDAFPSLLFDARREDARNDIELRSVSVHFSRDCVIDAADEKGTSGIYTVVRLNENDPDVIRMLLRLLEEAFQERKAAYTNKDIAARILELADLFKQIENSTGDTVGLWGELYILARSSNLENAVRCWCLHKKAKYDYIADDFALEAKTTVFSRRKHRFSLEQLRPNGDFCVYVASLLLVELNSGCTVVELMDELYSRISDNDLKESFLSQCLIKGGHDIYRNTLKLSVFPDGSSLVIFDSAHIPVPEIAPESPIDNVKFDVDLSNLTPLPNHEIETVLRFGVAV